MDVVRPAAALRPAAVVRPIAPALGARDAKARLEALVAELHAIKDQMAAFVYRTGTILRELQQREMIGAGECTSFEELLEKYDLPPRFTASKYMAVAETFAERDAVRLGLEKGYALVRYAKLVGTPAPVLVAQNPRIGERSLLDSDAAALGEAIRELQVQRRGGVEADEDTAEEADKAVRRLGPRLRHAGAPNASLRRVRRGSRYRVLVELDPDEAMALAERLRT